MQVFIYEYITGGGLLGGESPQGSLLHEGRAMVTALAADMAALEGVQVVVLWDGRLPPLSLPGVQVVAVGEALAADAAFHRLANESHRTLVIAPELDGILLDRCRTVERAGGRLLSPGSDVVKLTADKHVTAEHLRAAGVPAPRGVVLETGESLPRDFTYPAVLKPRLGAGSHGLQLVQSPNDVGRVMWPARLEEFCSGQPGSIAVISHGAADRSCVLPPCRQHLSQDGRFTYFGGSLPLPPEQADRSRRLAERVVCTLPPFTGYLGIDMVLGPATDGYDDRVIEINPRLTTSYVGLRVAVEENLAGLMLKPSGEEMRAISCRRDLPTGGIAFDADGRVREVCR